MYEVKPEPQFQTDYRHVMREHPELKPEFQAAVRELMQTDSVSEQYRPHMLQNPGGNYSGHIDFHLSVGKTDVTVLYIPHKTNPIIHLVRMGSHDELFHSRVK